MISLRSISREDLVITNRRAISDVDALSLTSSEPILPLLVLAAEFHPSTLTFGTCTA